MAVRAPISVVIDDGLTIRHVTARVSGLSFRKTAPGGFVSLSATITVPRDLFSNLGPADKIYIYGPTGHTLWEGFLDNPGASDGAGGQSFELSAMGTMMLAKDLSMRMPFIDRSFSEWEERSTATATSATASASPDPDAADGVDSEGIKAQFNPGQPINTNSVAQMAYDAFAKAGWQFGAARVTYKSGKTDSAYRNDMGYVGGFSALNSGITTGDVTASRANGDSGHPPSGSARITLRLRRSGGATNVADDNTWTWFSDLSMVGRRMDRNGNLLAGIAGMQAYDYVRADWVVEDLVGRALVNVADPHGVTIDATSHQIDQLAYHEPVTASQVFDDLGLWESDHYWGIGASTHRGVSVWYVAWPTAVRYEVSTRRDDYDAPGSEVDLCNMVVVEWTDAKGKPQTTTVYAASEPGIATPWLPDGAVPTVFSHNLKGLEDEGRTREAERIPLPDGQGSEANALRIGEQELAARANPPKSATVTVSRPLDDMLIGGHAMPYEIEPGCNVRVRETGDVLRLTETNYVDDSESVVLTLGTPVLTRDQRIARAPKAKR